MKKCPYCSAQIADRSLFCEMCGKKQPQGKVCSWCGMPINDGDVFCGNCGHKIEEGILEVAPAAEADAVAEVAPVGKKCPHCGGAVEEENVFCQTCGKKMDVPEEEPAPRYRCKRCGKELESDDVLCKECWAAEQEKFDKEKAERAQRAGASELEVAEEENNSLKTVVIVLMCVSVLIGGGLLYFLQSSKQEYSINNDDNSSDIRIGHETEILSAESKEILSNGTTQYEGDMVGFPIEFTITKDAKDGGVSAIYKNVKYSTTMQLAGILQPDGSLMFKGKENGRTWVFHLDGDANALSGTAQGGNKTLEVTLCKKNGKDK